ncbi:hypothetical protein Cgig2_016798 [Carnegiea gigantea]|uniref:Uncharacterized protein n=1 Tax=Carnegiea gigantea TaxID=171969 RepID=A0A9Q1GZX0_9CARY|nr:hypothetical protein Cgig2_016798 [Carnegiea gigantea]
MEAVNRSNGYPLEEKHMSCSMKPHCCRELLLSDMEPDHHDNQCSRLDRELRNCDPAIRLNALLEDHRCGFAADSECCLDQQQHQPSDPDWRCTVLPPAGAISPSSLRASSLANHPPTACPAFTHIFWAPRRMRRTSDVGAAFWLESSDSLCLSPTSPETAGMRLSSVAVSGLGRLVLGPADIDTADPIFALSKKERKMDILDFGIFNRDEEDGARRERNGVARVKLFLKGRTAHSYSSLKF